MRFLIAVGGVTLLTMGAVALPKTAQAQITLFDNGTLVGGVGDGFGGANTSQAEPTTYFGASLNLSEPAMIADDFTVAGGSWELTRLHWYGYQTFSTTTSTFTGAYVTLYDGVPGAPGTSVVAGDFTTNRLTASTFSNIYRVSRLTGPTDTTRPIMALTIDMTWVPNLLPGTYWVGVGATGSLSGGPFLPLRSVLGGSSNMMAFSGGWSTFDADNATGGVEATEASFQLVGNLLASSSAPEPGTLALVALGIAGGLAARRRRK
jgi:PEP-CTERM motif